MNIPTALQKLETQGNLRTLHPIRIEGNYLIDKEKQFLNLSSNDYLGIGSSSLFQDFFASLDTQKTFLLSNPSSRLVTGNSEEYSLLEDTLSSLFPEKSALVLSSGYLVNSGVLPALVDKNDIILADKLVHASLIDGLKLSGAPWHRFAHNDMNHLETLLQRHQGKNIWVVTESLFSMDGDRAPLTDIVALKHRYGFQLYLDEAHAFGVLGATGAGLAHSLGLSAECTIMVATLGKAAASSGAFVLCSADQKKWLINKMRPLIFSTALPPISLLWSHYVVSRFPQMTEERARLHRHSQRVCSALHTPITSHIIPIPAGENARALALSQLFKEAGYWLTPIRHPTVPQGTARLRLSLTASLSETEISHFITTCNTIG